MFNKLIVAFATVGLMFSGAKAFSQEYSENVVRIGVLTDLNSIYSDIGGTKAIEAVKMAVEDFGGVVNGVPIEVVYADHQNKPDVAAAIARKWYFNDGVDMITNIVGSGGSMAVSEVARNAKKLAFMTGAYTASLTGENCSPYTIHYQNDTIAMANAPAALTKDARDTWYFITADYVFGATMQDAATAAITRSGGEVIGSVKHPTNALDFSSFVLQAKASGAKYIALANAGANTINSIKSINEFGLMQNDKQRAIALGFMLDDVHALGLDVAQGIYTTQTFYWDMDDDAREWALRYYDRVGKMPSEVTAADYSSTMQYLKSVKAVGTDKTENVNEYLRGTQLNDFYTRGATIRADGRLMKDVYLVQVKSPENSKEEWDYFDVKRKIPANDAFLPVKDSKCPLLQSELE